MDDLPGRHLIANDRIEVLAFARRVQEQQESPGDWHPEEKGALPRAEGPARRGRTTGGWQWSRLRIGAPQQEHRAHGEERKSGGSEGRWVCGDEEPGETEDPRGPRWRPRVAERDARSDGPGHQRDAADHREHPEVANERALGELLDQGGAEELVILRQGGHLVDEHPVGDSLQHLPGAIEDGKADEPDPADPRCGGVDAPEQDCERKCHQRDEHHCSDVDDQHSRPVAVQVGVDLLAVTSRVKQQEDRPGDRHPDDERGLPASQTR